MLRREGIPFSITYMDLDNFKGINDTYGHDAGDEILRYVGDTIKSNIRPTDVAIRKGGDEFIFFFSGNDCEKPLERLLSELNGAQIEHEGQNIDISCSMGTVKVDSCALDRGGYLDFDSILKRADDVLYKAKNEKGRLLIESTTESLSYGLSGDNSVGGYS